MLRSICLVNTFCVLLFFITPAIGQDSAAVKDWIVESKKIGSNKYELIFNAPIQGNWQVYAPQVLLEVPTTHLQFFDSSITQQGEFVLPAPAKRIRGVIFDDSVSVFTGKAAWTATIDLKEFVPAKLQGILHYTYGRDDEFYQALDSFTVVMEGGVESTDRILISTIDIDHPIVECGDTVKQDSSYLAIFLFGFLGGLIALLTPCVFPMIPLTVSFFTNKAGQRSKGVGNALLYGFFIFLIYILLTIPFHIAGNTNPEIFNNISTNVWLNLFFFAIFIVFAISFFGFFEITLPASVANKADSKSGLGNIAGIFFMALTLAIVSFSCTGPILGTLLANVATEGAWPLTAGIAGFGLALGLPFALFALFPKWLQSLPKSGGWMTDLKIVLGFVEVALAIKFLATADNVKQWGILKREIFIGSWVIIGFLTTLYLFGVIRVFKSTKPKKLSKARIFFAVLFAAMTLYLIPGVTNTKWARLSLISGFPPPSCYSIYSHPVNCDDPLLDYEQAIQLAKKENKPVLIDFTGWGCVNCRRMEENVWTDPRVEKLMKEEFILVSLYVDESTKLPAARRMTYTSKTGTEKSIITVGDKWTNFQIDNFKATAQPQYAMVTPDEKALTKTKFYTPNAGEFAEWLQCGLDAFKKAK